ncbi:MAG: iron-sulfur cluster repair di-iron protein [Bacteroidota bacterium]
MKTTNIPNIDIEQTTIGELVAQNYHSAGVFKQYGLDFCCGGGRTISKACETKGISVDELLDDLNEIAWSESDSSQQFQAWDPAHLIDHIMDTHHRYVRQKTEEITAYAAKVARVHGERHPENKEIYLTFAKLSQELLNHLSDEEKTVFPLIKSVYKKRMKGEEVTAKECVELKRQLQLMVGDHQEAGDEMAYLRSVSNEFTPPQDACTTYRILYQNLADFEEDLHQHVHLENNILFKKAHELI